MEKYVNSEYPATVNVPNWNHLRWLSCKIAKNKDFLTQQRSAKGDSGLPEYALRHLVDGWNFPITGLLNER